MTDTGKSNEKPKSVKDAAAGKGRLAITLVRSGICTPKDQKATLVGLGFGRLGTRVVRDDSAAVRGMIRKVRHLVEVEKG